VEIIVIKDLISILFGKPECNVFVASWEFRVMFEFIDLSIFELTQEPLVLTPEQSNVVNIKQFHCPSL
jgi:hypothetical protein